MDCLYDENTPVRALANTGRPPSNEITFCAPSLERSNFRIVEIHCGDAPVVRVFYRPFSLCP